MSHFVVLYKNIRKQQKEKKKGNPKFSLGKFILLSFPLRGKTIYCKYE